MQTDELMARRPSRSTTATTPLDPQLLRRVVVEGVHPEVDGGRFPVKRVVGEEVVVSADVHADGHDVLAAVLLYRKAGAAAWEEARMTPVAARFSNRKFGRVGVLS